MIKYQYRSPKLNPQEFYKVPNLMFQHILKLKTDGVHKSQQKPQQNAPSPLHTNLQLAAAPKLSVNISQFIQTKNLSKQPPKRLKLKDYMRLNEISKEKRYRSVQHSKMGSNKKLIQNSTINLQATFGKAQEPDSLRKSTRSYNQQAQIQRSLLMETVSKIKESFNQIILLIEESTKKFKNYNDLVFMFRIEEVLSDYIKTGINKLTDSYKDYIITDVNGGTIKQIISMRLDQILLEKKTESPQKDFSKQQVTKDYIKHSTKDLLEEGKMVQSNVLPVSVNLPTPPHKKQIEKQYRSAYITKR